MAGVTKQAAMVAYRLSTLPLRRFIGWQRRRNGTMPVTGLFLHRVADDQPNPWSMTNAQFDALLHWLQRNVDLVSTDEAQQLIRQGNRGRVAVNISFDDGYADNFLHAIPTLLNQKVPFTYYVTSKNVETSEPFPHDVKNEQLLAPNSIEEIRALAQAGVEIGVHTRTHPDMGQVLEPDQIADEIGGARSDLRRWIGREPQHFAFPFGQANNITPRAIQYLADQGFSSYCSAFGGYNQPFHDSFHLYRFHGDPVLERVKNWLTLDPRWVWAPPSFDYIPFTRPQSDGEPQLSSLGER